MRSRYRIATFVVLAILSIAAKLFLAGQGHNIDMESWSIFAKIIRDGKNLYAETFRIPYHPPTDPSYGPVWCYVGAGVSYVQAHVLGSDSLHVFHRLLALLLSLVDVAIGYLLARRYSFVAGALFLVNPVSLLVTGFHSQFDNVAVLLGLAACLLLDKNARTPRFALAMFILGVSLAVKHVLIFLPLWFFFHPGSSRPRRLLSLLPYGIFAASFLPFIGDERGLEGVIEGVLMYGSFHLDAFFPHLVQTAIPVKAIEVLFARVPIFPGFKFVWLVAMLLVGFAVREKRHLEQLLVYLAAIVVFSSAVADQYLAIPLATCAVYWRHFSTWWYVVVSALYLAATQTNIGMLPSMTSYSEKVLGLGLERSQPIAALLVFLILYLSADRRHVRSEPGRRWTVPWASANPGV
jgi:hypothetical protein